jgi:hypothetical protein
MPISLLALCSSTGIRIASTTPIEFSEVCVANPQLRTRVKNIALEHQPIMFQGPMPMPQMDCGERPQTSLM